jgi:hypothetical protein
MLLLVSLNYEANGHFYEPNLNWEVIAQRQWLEVGPQHSY